MTLSADLLKDGTKHLSGLEQAVLRNIEAVSQLADKTRTSMGPNGMNKMVINHLDKLFVTHDSATILKELEVIHPAAKVVVMAAKSQEAEIGDGTNFVISFAGELLQQADGLLRMMRLHPSEIITGYKMAMKKALEILEKQVVYTVKDLKSKEEISKAMRAVVGAKQYGYEDALVPLIAEACINALPKNPLKFNVDNVRVCKIPGASVSDSFLIHGFALQRDTKGTVKHVKNAKIAIYTCNVDVAQLDTKETIELRSAEELLNFSKSEEKTIEEDINAIAKTGVNVIITSGSFGEMAMHFIERHKMMAIKVSSKFDLRRICKATGATPLVRFGAPVPEEIGTCDAVDVKEIGLTKVIVFDNRSEKSPISTIVVRGATQNILEELERGIDDGVNVYKALCRDQRLVAGAGAVEMALYRGVLEYADQQKGLEQYAIRKYAEAFQVIPRTLAESAGFFTSDVISKLNAAHSEGKTTFGVDIDSVEGKDAVKAGIYDSYLTKLWGIRLATQAAITVLSVDQIIMARPAGGPKPKPQPRSMDVGDD